MTSYTSAGELCRLIISRVDGVGDTDWLGGSVYAYGAGPNDAVLSGMEHTTTVLVVTHGEQRWFQLEIREFDPAQQPVLALDYDVVQSLTRRAGLTPPLL